jgi:hypothetical protein
VQLVDRRSAARARLVWSSVALEVQEARVNQLDDERRLVRVAAVQRLTDAAARAISSMVTLLDVVLPPPALAGGAARHRGVRSDRCL